MVVELVNSDDSGTFGWLTDGWLNWCLIDGYHHQMVVQLVKCNWWLNWCFMKVLPKFAGSLVINGANWLWVMVKKGLCRSSDFGTLMMLSWLSMSHGFEWFATTNGQRFASGDNNMCLSSTSVSVIGSLVDHHLRAVNVNKHVKHHFKGKHMHVRIR